MSRRDDYHRDTEATEKETHFSLEGGPRLNRRKSIFHRAGAVQGKDVSNVMDFVLFLADRRLLSAL